MNNHLSVINDNSEYKNMVFAIRDGVLQYTWDKPLTPEIHHIVSIFNKCARELSKQGRITVYRALRSHSASIQREYYHPYPFSTTLSLEFAREWLGDDTGVILQFDLQPSELYIVVDSDIEREVIVGAGTITLIDQEDNGVWKCDFSA